MNPLGPIGIFDSGIGGLSVTREIQHLLPYENLLYIADSAFAPYGNKPLEWILQRCHSLTQFLADQNAKAVVVACNTATAAAIGELRQHFSLPVIAMEPGVKPAIAATRSGVVGVLATENTLLSKQFTTLLHRYAEDVKVVSQPCPGLVEQVEAGEFDNPVTRQLIRRYVEPLLQANADTIVLGCTHYPLLAKQIADIIGPGITFIETGQAVARQLARKLTESQLQTTSNKPGTVHYWTSGNVDHIGAVISTIMGTTIRVEALPE